MAKSSLFALEPFRNSDVESSRRGKSKSNKEGTSGMTRTIRYDKLVRDAIPEIIAASGKTPEYRTLDADEFQKAVDAKLSEELAEYLDSGDVAELADLLETLYAAAKARGFSCEELEAARVEKAKKRGAFEKRLFLIAVREKE